jgi:Ca2+-binding RTX toxin-like protein
MEHVWDSLWSEWTSGLPERQAGQRLLQLAAQVSPAAADSLARSGATQIVMNFERPAAALTVIPAVVHDRILQDAEPAGPVAATAETPVETLSTGGSDRSGMVAFAGGGALPFGTPSLPFANSAANFVVLYGDDFQSGLVVNTSNKTLLEGGPGDWPELGRGDDDTLELSGDFSSGFVIPGQPQDIDNVVLRAGNDYNLVVDEDHVAPGETMTVNGMPLGAGNHVIFDGSAESDGSFVFFGSQAGDSFIGGGGDDRIVGLGGADTLAGGGGADRFVYTGADESTGGNYDTLADFDPTADRIDLLSGVASWGTAITSGTLSQASFGTDLGAAMAGLEAAQANWFAPDAGDLAGTIFLVVDANGVAGYQEGEDYVFAIGGAPLSDLTGHTDIFI